MWRTGVLAGRPFGDILRQTLVDRPALAAKCETEVGISARFLGGSVVRNVSGREEFGMLHRKKGSISLDRYNIWEKSYWVFIYF